MTTVVRVTKNEFDLIWAELKPNERHTVTRNELIIPNTDGAILLTHASVEVADHCPNYPDKIKSLLRAAEERRDRNIALQATIDSVRTA